MQTAEHSIAVDRRSGKWILRFFAAAILMTAFVFWRWQAGEHQRETTALVEDAIERTELPESFFLSEYNQRRLDREGCEWWGSQIASQSGVESSVAVSVAESYESSGWTVGRFAATLGPPSNIWTLVAISQDRQTQVVASITDPGLEISVRNGSEVCRFTRPRDALPDDNVAVEQFVPIN